MAGPRFLSTGGVIDPYASLQNAVSGVGQIYRGYEEDARKAEEAARRQSEYQANVDERNRAKGLRQYAADYDAKVGENYRGISSDIRPLVEQQEAAARTKWQAANPNATAEQTAKLESGILDARRSLASSEDVEAAVATDLIKAGFNPADVEALSKYLARGYSSRGAAYTNAKEQAKEYNDALDNRIKNAVDLAKIDSNSADARVGALGRYVASNNAGRSTADKSKGAGTGGFDLFDPAAATASQKYLVDTIGSGDASRATVNMMAGLSQYNSDQEKAGLPRLSSKEATAIMLGDIDQGLLGSDVRFQSPEEFKVVLQQKQATANAKAAEAKAKEGSSDTDKSKGDMSVQEYRDLIASQGGGAPSGLRNAILNPNYMNVSYDQVNTQRVASAYARLFPEAAKANGITAPAATNAPSRETSNPVPNRRIAAPVDKGASKPLPDLKQSGTGQVDLGEGNTKETPAGGTSSPVRPETTPARALAEEIVSYQNSGTNGDIDLPRVLQTLRVRNPDMYNSVMREKADLDSLDRNIKALEGRTTSLQSRLGNQNILALSTDTPRPVVTSGMYGSYVTAPTDSPYEQFLKEQETLKGLQQQLLELRQRKPVVNPNAPQDFTRLRSMLTY